MKKQANPTVSDSSSGTGNPSEPLAEALHPSEITLVLTDAQATSFEPLPQDFAPTQPVPEGDSPDHPPEYRSSEELSTFAIPIKDISQSKTANIAPVLLEGAQSRETPIASTPTDPPRKSSGKLWLGLGACALLAAGAAIWFLWPALQSRLQGSPTATGQESTQSASEAAPREAVPREAVPPELRTYMDQAKAGDAKAMHMIALMYWNGLNVRQDRAKGMEWYRKAATAGSTAAQQFLKDNGQK